METCLSSKQVFIWNLDWTGLGIWSGQGLGLSLRLCGIRYKSAIELKRGLLCQSRGRSSIEEKSWSFVHNLVYWLRSRLVLQHAWRPRVSRTWSKVWGQQEVSTFGPGNVLVLRLKVNRQNKIQDQEKNPTRFYNPGLVSRSSNRTKRSCPGSGIRQGLVVVVDQRSRPRTEIHELRSNKPGPQLWVGLGPVVLRTRAKARSESRARNRCKV